MMQALHVCRDRRQCDSESFLSENCRRIRQDAYFLTALQRRPQTGKSLRGHTFDKALWIVPGLVLPLNSLKTS